MGVQTHLESDNPDSQGCYCWYAVHAAELEHSSSPHAQQLPALEDTCHEDDRPDPHEQHVQQADEQGSFASR